MVYPRGACIIEPVFGSLMTECRADMIGRCDAHELRARKHAATCSGSFVAGFTELNTRFESSIRLGSLHITACNAGKSSVGKSLTDVGHRFMIHVIDAFRFGYLMCTLKMIPMSICA